MSNATINEKREFIRHFLKHYQLKRREAVWILNYLDSHERLLEKVIFVEDAKHCPRGIVMSANCVDDAPFHFYKSNIMTTDAEKSFHDIRLNRDQNIYIQLNFKNKYHDKKYISIVEDNNFAPKDLKANKNDAKIAGEFLDYCLAHFQKQELERKINEALDNNKKRTFNKLSKEYSKLEIPMGNFKIIKKRDLY